jgi:hypothetical protein
VEEVEELKKVEEEEQEEEEEEEEEELLIITVSDQKAVEINMISIPSLRKFKIFTDGEVVPLYLVMQN